MKNKLLLLVILGITFFASCSDDDDKYGRKILTGLILQRVQIMY